MHNLVTDNPRCNMAFNIVLTISKFKQYQGPCEQEHGWSPRHSTQSKQTYGAMVITIAFIHRSGPRDVRNQLHTWHRINQQGRIKEGIKRKSWH